MLDEERVRLRFRNPMKSGQTEMNLHPLALMRRLAWLVPPPGQIASLDRPQVRALETHNPRRVRTDVAKTRAFRGRTDALRTDTANEPPVPPRDLDNATGLPTTRRFAADGRSGER
jgi:hypothetical protein